MHTSGLILDAHDDPSVARELPDGFGEEHVKTALSLSTDDLEALPDHVFALVRELPDGGRMRKFACVDAGTSALSLAAFLKHGHKIGHHDEWAAVGLRLRKDCLGYGLPDPAHLLQEKAAGLGAAMLGYAAKNPLRTAAAATTLPSSVRGTTDNIKQNLQEVRHHERFASLGPQSKEAQHYALPSERLYPLDTYPQVGRAMEYFDEQCWSMSPEVRREYCTNVEKRASALLIRCPEKIAAYASTDYADEDHVLASLARRRQYLPEADGFLPKLASMRGDLSPDEFCEALREFDKAAGLDAHYGPNLPDAYLSTYGVKRAEEFREAVGKTDTVTEAALAGAATNRRGDVSQVFGEAFCDKFFKDPVGAFKSLPIDQKKLLARIANDTAPRG